MQGLTPDRPARSDRAFVTLVTNADYALGAKALVRSIVLSGTQADICVLHTDVAEADDSLRCVLLQGAGGHFCAGGDVKGFNERGGAGAAWC